MVGWTMKSTIPAVWNVTYRSYDRPINSYRYYREDGQSPADAWKHAQDGNFRRAWERKDPSAEYMFNYIISKDTEITRSQRNGRYLAGCSRGYDGLFYHTSTGDTPREAYKALIRKVKAYCRANWS